MKTFVTILLSFIGVLACFALAGFLTIEMTGDEEFETDIEYDREEWKTFLLDMMEKKVTSIHIKGSSYRVEYKDGKERQFKGIPWQHLGQGEKKAFSTVTLTVEKAEPKSHPSSLGKILGLLLFVAGAALGIFGIITGARWLVFKDKKKQSEPAPPKKVQG